jgi:hypothetical protein
MTRQPINAVAVRVSGYGASRLIYSDGEGLTPVVNLDADLPFDIAATADGYQPYAQMNLPPPQAAAIVLLELDR